MIWMGVTGSERRQERERERARVRLCLCFAEFLKSSVLNQVSEEWIAGVDHESLSELSVCQCNCNTARQSKQTDERQ